MPNDGGRTRIGNTPTCEDCGKPLEGCTCDTPQDETITTTQALPATPANIGKAVARCFFDRRGNHSEAHVSENELAALIAEAVKLYETKTKGGN